MSTLCVVFLFFSIFLPIVFIYQLNRNFEHLGQDAFKKRYGALYVDLNLKAGKKVLYVPSFFLIRRMMLGIAICTVGKVLIWQVFIMTSQIIVGTIIIGKKVYDTQMKTRMEFFNEVILMMTMYSIICFSPFIFDTETKFYLGYVTISIVCLHLAVNFFLIFKGTFLEMKLKCRKCQNRRANSKSRDLIKQRLDETKEYRRNRLRKHIESVNKKQLREAEYLPTDESEIALKRPVQLAHKQRKSPNLLTGLTQTEFERQSNSTNDNALYQMDKNASFNGGFKIEDQLDKQMKACENQIDTLVLQLKKVRQNQVLDKTMKKTQLINDTEELPSKESTVRNTLRKKISDVPLPRRHESEELRDEFKKEKAMINIMMNYY